MHTTVIEYEVASLELHSAQKLARNEYGIQSAFQGAGKPFH